MLLFRHFWFKENILKSLREATNFNNTLVAWQILLIASIRRSSSVCRFLKVMLNTVKRMHLILIENYCTGNLVNWCFPFFYFAYCAILLSLNFKSHNNEQYLFSSHFVRKKKEFYNNNNTCSNKNIIIRY